MPFWRRHPPALVVVLTGEVRVIHIQAPALAVRVLVVPEGDPMSEVNPGGQPITLKATALDAAGNVTSVPIAFAEDTGAAPLVDNGDGTATVAYGSDGVSQITATATNPDGSTVPSAPFEVDAVTPPPPVQPAVSVTIEQV